jgi:hypothetical protein
MYFINKTARGIFEAYLKKSNRIIIVKEVKGGSVR